MTETTTRALNYGRIVGADGWQYVSQIDDIDEKIAGIKTLCPAEYIEFSDALSGREMWCREHGAKYAFMIAPNKATIYPEYLPAENMPSPYRDLINLDYYLGDRYINPVSALIAEKKIRQVYFKTDDHWNWYGAYIAYCMVMDRLGLTPISLSEYTETPARMIGSQEAISDKPVAENIVRLIYKGAPAIEVFSSKSTGRGKAQVFKNSDDSLPTAVMFRDSYGTFMIPFLSQSFSRLVVVSHRGVMRDLIRHEKPSFVIHELCERYIDPVLSDDLNAPFEEYCGVSLEALP